MDRIMPRASNQPRAYSRREVLRLGQSAGSSLLFGLSGALTFPAIAKELSPRDAAVDRLITQAMEDQHISGLSMAVLKNGSLLRSAGYGQFDRKLGLPTAASTVFRIGSLSKQFLASAIMLLLQRQALVLDDPVREYLPTAPQLWNRISVRHLLSHTSGLIREAPGYNKDRLQDDATVIKSAYEEPLLFAPGNSYSYSNLGYFILAEMITRISKQKWWNFVQEQIFKAVGMGDTQPTTVAPTAAFASGYRWREGRWHLVQNPAALRPSGAFVSTVVDLAKWDKALVDNQILSPASLKQMWSPTTLNNGHRHPYGFGWQVAGGHGHLVVSHGGSEPGFSSTLVRMVDAGMSLIVLTNAQHVTLAGLSKRILAAHNGDTAALKLPGPEH